MVPNARNYILSYIYLKTAKICFLYISRNTTIGFCHNQFKLYVYFIFKCGSQMLFIFFLFCFIVAFWLQLVKTKNVLFHWYQRGIWISKVLIFLLRKGQNVRNCRLSFSPDIPKSLPFQHPSPSIKNKFTLLYLRQLPPEQPPCGRRCLYLVHLNEDLYCTF